MGRELQGREIACAQVLVQVRSIAVTTMLPLTVCGHFPACQHAREQAGRGGVALGGVTGGVQGGATFTGDVTEPCATPRAQLSALLTAAAAVARDQRDFSRRLSAPRFCFRGVTAARGV